MLSEPETDAGAKAYAAAIAAAKRHLADCIRGKTNSFETHHPWRKGWEFVYFHSLRVDAICQKLAAVEAPTLPPAEALELHLAAVLHDLGRLENREVHAALGAQLTAAWLEAHPEIASLVRPERVVDLVAHHSEKDQPGPDLGHALLKDADTLDEIGIFSVMMSANWLDRASPYFFYDLAGRLECFEIPFCEKKSAQLQTAAARACLDQKRRFIETTIAQLHLELEGVDRDDPFLQAG
jgi:uncharacterized protein